MSNRRGRAGDGRDDLRAKLSGGIVAAWLFGLLPLALAGSAARGADALSSAFPLSFDSEWIRLSIAGDSLEVRGTYWLTCRRPTSAPTPLFYPFPRDSLLGGARMVSLMACVDRGESAPATWKEIPGIWGVRWVVSPCSGDTIRLDAVYRQRIRTNYARYIVTTTQKWDRPLRRARFEIRLPAGAEPEEFSFPFTLKEAGGDRYYGFEAEGFFPDHDIVVRWKPPGR